MRDRRVRSIAILGGGAAGWMTAAALAKAVDPQLCRIDLIESDEIGIIGVGEATIPTIHWFNQLLGLDEAEFMRETKATYKLGIEFRDWARPGHAYFHPFGRFGGPNDGTAFHHRWIKARLEGLDTDLARYSLTTQAAKAGKFAFPARDPKTLLSTLGYAYHFDAGLYGRYLRAWAERRGVQRHEGKVTEIDQHPETGFVTTLHTDRGEAISADLFIDCTGFRGLLIEQTLKTGFEDWSGWLPCDRALAVPCERSDRTTPYTTSTARPAGWQWRIPLQHRTGNGYVYASRFTSDDEAAALLLNNLDGAPLAEPRPIRFTTGRRREPWNKNVIAIGLSSGFLEPLESTSIHLIQSAIAKLLSLFPDRDCDPRLAERFNRLLLGEFEDIRDFLVLHYTETLGRTEPMWEWSRSVPVPESLADRKAHFIRAGRIVVSSDELFREASWLAVLVGQGVAAEDYNPLTDSTSTEENRAYLDRLEGAIAAACAPMLGHDAHLQKLDR